MLQMLVGALVGVYECQPRNFGLDSVGNWKKVNVFEQKNDRIKTIV